MSEIPTSECIVCRKPKGEIEIPGGVNFENELVFISHAQLWGNEKEHYLGHVFVDLKRHVAELADLTEEDQAVGLFSGRVAKARLSTEAMEHVYTFFIGDGVPHVHIHMMGRYPNAPREYWAPKVNDWPEAPKGTAKKI